MRPWRLFFGSKIGKAQQKVTALGKRVLVSSFPRELLVSVPDEAQAIEERHDHNLPQIDDDLE